MSLFEPRAAIRRFSQIAFWEGMSYLVLLFIAMPLKYWADMPLAVRIVGSVHGALFIAYVLLLAAAARSCGWPWTRSAWAFLASLIPFATFALEPGLKRDEQRLATAR